MREQSLYETAIERLGLAVPPSPPVRASASVVPWRRDAGGELEVFWVRRSPELKFMGGWYAFPGGTVEKGDAAIAVSGRPGGVDEAPVDGGMTAEFIGSAAPLPEILAPGVVAAALRELFEETGLLLTAGGQPPSEALAALRRQTGETRRSSAEELVRRGVGFDASSLTFAGRWLTPPLGPVRFDNRFFLLEWPADRPAQPAILPGELALGEWVRPSDAEARWRAGELLAAPPILHLLRVLREEGPEAGLRRLHDTREANVASFRRIEFVPGALAFPLATPTLPPATHTNAYLLGFGESVLVDPGSPDPEEQRRLLEALDALGREEDRRVREIWLTHHHPDHVGGVEPLARALGVPVRAHARTAARLAGLGVAVRGELEEGFERRLDGGARRMTLRVLETPGHARGHLAFLDVERGGLVAGDVISAVSTIVVDPPEGDMDDYLASLERLRSMRLTALLPGHGPALPEPQRSLAELIEHRLQRESRILEAWRGGVREAEAMLPTVYDDVPEAAWPLAARQIEAHLERLRRADRL